MRLNLLQKPLESTIAVLEDNIFSTEENVWKNAIATLGQQNLNDSAINNAANPWTERRREPRFSLSMPVEHRVKGQFTGWKFGKSIDVSQNGIRLAIDREIKVGTHLELHLKLPDVAHRVKLQGVVVWLKPSNNGRATYECGIAFESLRTTSKKDKIIHFMADRLCKLALQHTSGLTSRPAATKEDLLSAYSLVYKEYLGRGYCAPNPAELHYTFYCLLPESKTFILQDEGRILGTISLIVDSPLGIPMETLFKDKIANYKLPGKKIAEVSLLSLDRKHFGHKSFALTDFKKLAASFRLFKIMFDYARMIGVTDLFIAMHPKHKELYQYLRFEIVGPVRNYSGAQGNPALPMRMNISQVIETTPQDLGIKRYFVNETLPHELLERHMDWNAQSVHEFLFEIRAIWDTLSVEKQEFLLQCYPGLNSI